MTLDMNFRISSEKVGYALVTAGTLLQVTWGSGALFGWATAFVGSILCAKAITGDYSWCLIAFAPVFGAPIALGGMIAQRRWFIKEPPASNQRLGSREFLVVFAGMIILIVGMFIFGLNHALEKRKKAATALQPPPAVQGSAQ